MLSGLDADRAALHALTDPWPVNRHGEAHALIQGRATYDAIHLGHRVQLGLRGPLHILAPRRHPVVVEHRCGDPPTGREPWPATAHSKPQPEEPEF